MFWTVVVITIAAVGLFALGLSLTLIFRGHHIKSEIGENENMRRRGIKCAIETMREEAEKAQERGCSECPPTGCGGCTGAEKGSSS